MQQLKKKDYEDIKSYLLDGYNLLLNEDSIFKEYLDRIPSLKKLFSLDNFTKLLDDKLFLFLYYNQVIKSEVHTAGIKTIIDKITEIENSNKELTKEMIQLKKRLNTLESFISTTKETKGHNGFVTSF